MYQNICGEAKGSKLAKKSPIFNETPMFKVMHKIAHIRKPM
jgi:hypothetical protein